LRNAPHPPPFLVWLATQGDRREAHPTFLDLAQIEIELSQALGGKRVDVRTPEDLSRFFRDEVVSMAEVQYVAG
jgi:predicted nucleotidyltransferase